ncbi:MAG: hypothetical protein FWC92_02635 [Defluviitaleaceae bacterium]|nr:hypothetical protein [Defluviitaleaceae bacterium]
MARAKGQRSYNPEDIDFGYNVNNSPEPYPSGRPWSLMKRLAAKNIVLEAYNNPSTIEELSLALGISVPYIEDELKLILESDVIIKHPNVRLETNFIIYNAEMQKRKMEIMEEAGKQVSQLICEVIEKNMDKIRGIGFVNHDMPKEYLYWCLIHITLEKLFSKIQAEKNVGISWTKRHDGGEWDITAFEQWEQPISYSSSAHNTGYNTNVHGEGVRYFYGHHTIHVDDLYTKDSDYAMPNNDLLLLADIVRNNRGKSTLNSSECEIVDALVKNCVVHVSEDAIKINFPAFDESEKKEFSAYHDIVREIYEGEVYRLFENVYSSLYETMSNSLPDRFKKDGSVKKTAADLYSFRCILARHAYKNGIIKIPEGDDKSMITMYMGY